MVQIKAFFTAVLYQPLFNLLIFLAWLIPGHSIGWAIILLTVGIRAALIPSTMKTLEQQRRMKAIQPKLDALKEKHGDDKAAHSQATMELYAAEKISPFGGCLPTLIQIPILLTLYRVFMGGLSTSHFDLLYHFTPHMSTINTHFFGLDLSKPERWVLPIIVGILQYFQLRQTADLTPTTNPGQDGKDMSQILTKQMTIIGPVIAWSAARSFPSALALYYATFSIFMIIQQAIQLRSMPPLELDLKKGVTHVKKDGVAVTVRLKGDKGDTE